MSDTYDRNGVSITPLGGGVYELKHASIESEGNIEKVRGKENADARADEIAAAAGQAATDEGKMQSQGEIDGAATTLVGTGTQTPPEAAPLDTPPADPDAAEKLKAEQDRSAALEAKLADAEKERDELLEAAKQSADVVASVEEPKVAGRVPAGIPNQFAGDLSKETKQALKKAGLGYTRIVLEENTDIPPTGLFVGHNGRGYMIQPGEPVEVPDFVLGVLKDAKMSAPVVDSKSMKVLGYRERMKYPYRLAE